MNVPDAVILCGGLGKRLRSIVADKPKVMAQCNDRPFLDFVIEHLKAQGIGRIILCTGYKSNLVEEYYREDSKGIDIEFSREDEPLGTGGALKNARHFIESDPFFVLNGDSFCSIDYHAFLDFYNLKLARASIVVSLVMEGKDFGGITLDDSARIVGFREKPKENVEQYVNAGIYCFNEDIFSLMPDEARFSLEYDFFPNLIGKGFYGFRINKEFYDIGTPEKYENAKQTLPKEAKN